MPESSRTDRFSHVLAPPPHRELGAPVPGDHRCSRSRMLDYLRSPHLPRGGAPMSAILKKEA